MLPQWIIHINDNAFLHLHACPLTSNTDILRASRRRIGGSVRKRLALTAQIVRPSHRNRFRISIRIQRTSSNDTHPRIVGSGRCFVALWRNGLLTVLMLCGVLKVGCVGQVRVVRCRAVDVDVVVVGAGRSAAAVAGLGEASRVCECRCCAD